MPFFECIKFSIHGDMSKSKQDGWIATISHGARRRPSQGGMSDIEAACHRLFRKGSSIDPNIYWQGQATTFRKINDRKW